MTPHHVRTLVPLALLLALLLAGCVRSAGAPDKVREDGLTATPAASPAVPAPTALASPDSLPPPRSITLSAVGDVSLARQVNDWMAVHGPGYPFTLVAHLITGDLAIANLEGALTERGEPWPKGYTFRTPPRFAAGLPDAGFDLVSLANNHAMDFGVAGLQDTMAALDAADVRYAGAGRTAAEAWAPVTLTANGLTLAVVACALTPDEGARFSIASWSATDTAPGMAVCDTAALATAVSSAAAAADFVVAYVHAGDEYVRAPNATQRALADAALAAGADAFIGHHAHVVQPVEQRGGQLIAWGLGNFIFDLDPVDLANIPEPRVSLILDVTFTEGAGVTAWDAVPVVLDADEDRPRPATATEADALRAQLTP